MEDYYKIYHKQYYETNKEYLNAYYRFYYFLNSDEYKQRYNDKNKLIRNTAISFFKFYDRRRAQGLSLFGRDTPPGKTA
jgi:hypothetical protein